MKEGIALSGGGAKGDFEVGALKYIYANALTNNQPDIISGTSVGSINAIKLAEGEGGLAGLERIWLELQRNEDMYLSEGWLERIRDSRVRAFFERSFAENSVTIVGRLPFIFIDAIQAGIDVARFASDLERALGAKSIYNLSPINNKLQNRRYLDLKKVKDSSIELRIAIVGLESGQTHYVNKDGRFVESGRVMIADFSGGSGPEKRTVRYWEDYGESVLLEGWHDPDDLQLIGDFMGKGHDQVLFINRSGSGGRVLVADFSGGPGPEKRTVEYWENWGQSDLLGGWHDPDDLQLIGDFMGKGHDQVLFINRSGSGGRVMIADFSGGSGPEERTVEYWENWGQSDLLGGWHDPEDLQLVGDFMGKGHDQVLFINRSGSGGRVLVADFSGGSGPEERSVEYWENWGQSDLLGGWHDLNDIQLVGDFMGKGHDQVLFINRSSSGGRVMIADFSGGSGPEERSVEYWENWGQSDLLGGWHDPEDLQLVGDFMGKGHDQVLFINRTGGGGRVLIADFSGNSGPEGRKIDYWEDWDQSSVLDGWHDLDDIQLVGDLSNRGYDQVFFLNQGEPPVVDLLDAVLASASIPVVFPPVVMHGRTYVDGGVREVLPLEAVIDAGATKVFAIAASMPLPHSERPFTQSLIPGIGGRSVEILIDEVSETDLAKQWDEDIEVNVIQPTIEIHDTLTVDPGLISISIDYGYMRAFDVIENKDNGRLYRLSDRIATLRRDIWNREYHANGRYLPTERPSGPLRRVPDPEAMSQVREMKRELRTLTKERVNLAGKKSLPANPERWWQDWERHSWTPSPPSPWDRFISRLGELPSESSPPPL